LFKTMKMTHRSSLLDTHGTLLFSWWAERSSKQRRFRKSSRRPSQFGWVTLVFVVSCFIVVENSVSAWNAGHGILTPLQAALWQSVLRGCLQLALPITVVYLLTFALGWGGQQARIAGWIPNARVMQILQYTAELGLFCGVCAYAALSPTTLTWPVSTKAGLLMESAVLVMKLHSYLCVNASLHELKLEQQEQKAKRDKAKADAVPADQARAAGTTVKPYFDGTAALRKREARQRPEIHFADDQGSSTPCSTSEQSDLPSLTSPEMREKCTTNMHSQYLSFTFQDPQFLHSDLGTVTLRSRANSELSNGSAESPDGFTEQPSRRDVLNAIGKHLRSKGRRARSGELSQSRAAEELVQDMWTDLAPELAQVYPCNCTVYDFFLFSIMPTLVYSPVYPRTAKVRWSYVAEKALLIFLTLGLMVILLAHSFLPALSQPNARPVWVTVVQLTVPACLLWMLLWFLVFEALCNMLAELSRFGDRRFTEKFWNASSFTEFSRTWNTPVHTWLLVHVYRASQGALGLAPATAIALTFGVSIVAHELVINGLFGFVSPWLMLFSCIQFPLASIMRHKYLRGKRLGNMLFWAGLFTGVPIIFTLYAREYCSREPGMCESMSSLM